MKKFTDYTIEDLQNTDKQREVFWEMIKALENKGLCREVFHKLGSILVGIPESSV